MLTLELPDGTRTPTGHAALSVYNAAGRGSEARVIDAAGRVVYTTADLPRLRHDGAPMPFWLRTRFT